MAQIILRGPMSGNDIRSRAEHPWLVAQVRPNTEPHVVAELREMGFQAVCPSYRKQEMVGGSRRFWRGRERIEWVTRPAFPNYIIFSGPHWQRSRDVEELTRVIRETGCYDKPAHLAEPVAYRLLGPAGDGIVADLCQTVAALSRYLAGQSVRITSGLQGSIETGNVVSSTHSRVRILLASTGREISVPVQMVEPAA